MGVFLSGFPSKLGRGMDWISRAASPLGAAATSPQGLIFFGPCWALEFWGFLNLGEREKARESLQ